MTPTDSGHGLRLIPELLTEEVHLADNENSEHRQTEHRNLHGAQEGPDQGVDALHLLNGGAIGAFDRLVGGLLEAGLPVDLEDLVPHGYHG